MESLELQGKSSTLVDLVEEKLLQYLKENNYLTIYLEDQHIKDLDYVTIHDNALIKSDKIADN